MLDHISAASREFYEKTKLKLGIAFVVSAFSLMFLGFCSISGGISRSTQYSQNIYQSDGGSNSDQLGYYGSLVGAYGTFYNTPNHRYRLNHFISK